ncbi:hypothetical protein H0H81_008990 [Sphagnurus paluster]|uniref:F-box domain-containing protein n=1 Tax=Sphagnurus paluster TaxID=117069 RepID=A0A9P7GJV4_9AGAR|nr:hypothetical protein H0H81_008990 [Sphagnurus paluster]
MAHKNHGLNKPDNESNSPADVYYTAVSEKLKDTTINRLPDEVLAKILVLCVPKRSQARFISATLKICHVCSLWRSIALSYSEFWRVLVIDINDYLDAADALEEPPSGGTFELDNIPEFWFSRANVRPLSFTLKCDSMFFEPPVLAAIVSKVTPFSHRLQEIDLHVVLLDDLMPFLGMPGGSVPLLEKVTLKIQHPMSTPSANMTVFENARSLRAASIWISPNFWDEWDSFIFPSNQLTWLDFRDEKGEGLVPKIFQRILSKCPRIETATFNIGVDIDLDVDDDEGHPSMVNFTQLANLRLRFMGYADGDSLPHKWRFPALRTLEICCEFLEITFIFTIPPGVNPSSLRFLLLSDVAIDMRELVRFLGECNSLERLAINFPSTIKPRQFDVFLDRDARPTLPNLTNFAVGLKHESGAAELDEIIDMLCKIIISWFDGDSRKKSLEEVLWIFALQESSDSEDDDAKELEEIIEMITARIRGRLKNFLYEKDTLPSGLHLSSRIVGPYFSFLDNFTSFTGHFAHHSSVQ